MSDNHLDNSDWQLGMSLPSRKETHSKKKKSKDKHKSSSASAAPSEPEPPRRELNLQPELAQARAEVGTAAALSGTVSAEERDMLWGDDENEDGPILTKWQRLLLFVVVPVVILGVVAWGKIAYVHHVPQLVRDNVPAYASGEGFLVIKPWWFGPPVYELDSYPQTNDFTMYQTKMGDYATLVEDPFVLWRFQKDILN
jgi:hypothetical protein